MGNLSHSASGSGRLAHGASDWTPVSFHVVVVRAYQAFFTPTTTHTYTHPLPLPTLPPILHTICHRMRMQWNVSRELAPAGGQSLPINHASELMRSHQQNKYMDQPILHQLRRNPSSIQALLGCPACTSRDVEVPPWKEEGLFICEMLFYDWTLKAGKSAE